MSEQSTLFGSQWADKYQEAQREATRATKLELAGAWDAAFKTYISAAQTYLFVIRHTGDADTKAKLRAVSGKLLERAERIKAAKKLETAAVKQDRMSIEEQDSVLARGGIVLGLRVPRWIPEYEQEAASSSLPTEQPALSPGQVAASCRWLRAAEAFPGAAMLEHPLHGRSIVQANVSDCSVVAALIVAAEHHARFNSKLGISCLFPQDSTDLPRLSSSGIYTARFLVNGTWRRITVDDKLPVAESELPMCATTLENDQLWPALLEKAYLRLMGGYAFVGSNSANDLHAMSGWLPETLSTRTNFRSEQTWTRLSKGFLLGKCVLTLGTGGTADSPLCLIPSHNYAVVDLRERAGRREVVFVNPWRSRPPDETWTSGLREALPGEEDENASVIDWADISTHFASIHINWDSSDFDHSSSVHMCVARQKRHSTQLRLSLSPNPTMPSDVWLFLTRHTDSPLAQDEFMSLGVSSAVGDGQTGDVGRLELDDASSMTNSPFHLFRFRPSPNATTYDIVVSHEGPSAAFAFSLQAFSNLKVELQDGPPPLPHSASLEGAWAGATAGGNHTCCTFLNNPQYHIKLGGGAASSSSAEVEIVAETSKDSPVNVKLLYAGGERVGDFNERDVAAGGSSYNYGRDSLRKTGLSPGSYTLVVSSFQPHHPAPFSLLIKSSLPVEVSPIPAEGAGLYARTVRGAWSLGEDGGSRTPLQNPRFMLKLTRPARVKIRLQLPQEPKPSALSVYSATATGEPDELIASTLPYSDPVCGIVLAFTRLQPKEHGYLVVPSTYTPAVHASFQILLFADAPVAFS
ncbi:hypothetical protein JCM10207_004945 [Rhodosporidiobolus poonsookiae]